MSTLHCPRIALASVHRLCSAFLKALLCAAAVGFGCVAHAQDAQAPARIGFINIERILQDSAPAHMEAQQLRQEFLPRSEKIKAMAQELDALRAKLQDNSLVMSDDQRIATQTRVAELAQHVQDEQQAFNEDLDAQREADIQGLLKRTNLLVDEIASRRHFDIVFQSAVYVNPRLDLTDAVMQALAAPAGKDANP